MTHAKLAWHYNKLATRTVFSRKSMLNIKSKQKTTHTKTQLNSITMKFAQDKNDLAKQKYILENRNRCAYVREEEIQKNRSDKKLIQFPQRTTRRHVPIGLDNNIPAKYRRSTVQIILENTIWFRFAYSIQWIFQFLAP